MATKPTVEAAKKSLESRRFDLRRRGMEMLAELGERELMLQYALREKAPAVYQVAAEALYPEPVALVLHQANAVKGPDAHLHMKYGIARGNYQHAAEALAELYQKRKSKLHFEVIEATGLAELASFTPYLGKYLSAKLENSLTASRRGDTKANEGLSILVSSDGSDVWTRNSSCAIEAAVALRRLGADVDKKEIHRLRYEITDAMEDCYERQHTDAKLSWVLFDLGDEEQLPQLVEQVRGYFHDEFQAELLTSLLRKSRFDEVVKLADSIEDLGIPSAFHFWPLRNFLETKGRKYKAYERGDMYRKSRNLGLDPPNWWSWVD